MESEASPSPSRVRMALVGPCHPLSLFRRIQIRDSTREYTGRGILDVVETGSHHLTVASCYRHYSFQRCNLVADDARFDDARIDV